MDSEGSHLAAYDARSGQSLEEHLSNVADNVDRLLADAGSTAYGDDWATIGRALAWTHDAGKLTTWFQEYLRADDRSVAPTDDHTYHAFVGGLLAWHVLHELDASPEAQKAAFYAVNCHHGVLPNVPTAHQEFDSDTDRQRVENRFDLARTKLEDIDRQASLAADELLEEASDGVVSWSDVPVSHPSDYGYHLGDGAALDDRFYETVLRAWSTLNAADKLDAAGFGVDEAVSRPRLEALEEHVAELRAEVERSVEDGSVEDRLNTLRNDAHREATASLQAAHASGDRLFRITLPTGFGKTLTGLRAALELADETDGRVIYSLPYTSIIDQVDEECRSIFDLAPGDPEYTNHHHLAETWTRSEAVETREEVSDGSESLHAEAWQSGLVLTTFVQLFESVAGPGNYQSTKLPSLQNSVIVVDEPQALSIRWWMLVGRLSDFLTREYDATVVFMTATQPEILERNPDLPSPTPLTDQFEDCVELLSERPRVAFELHRSVVDHLEGGDEQTLSFRDASDELQTSVSGSENVLAIVNTVDSAVRLSELLAEDTGDGQPLQLSERVLEFYRETNVDPNEDIAELADDYLAYLDERSDGEDRPFVLATLTTRLRPVERTLLVEALRHVLADDCETPFDDVPLVTVSTQLIEAGVDVSFDALYRDLAPIPALVQAAGRCNRNFEGATSTVTVWRLEPPRTDGSIPSEVIYGDRSLLRSTRHALRELASATNGANVRIPESDVIGTGVEQYYDELHSQHRTSDRSDELADHFDAGRAEALRDATLIEEEYETVDVAVLASDTDRSLYEEYERYRRSEQWQRANEALDRLKPLIVSVPVDDVPEGEPDTLLAVDATTDRFEYECHSGRGVVESTGID